MRVSCFGVFVARQVCLVFEEGDSWICVFSRGRVGFVERSTNKVFVQLTNRKHTDHFNEAASVGEMSIGNPHEESYSSL